MEIGLRSVITYYFEMVYLSFQSNGLQNLGPKVPVLNNHPEILCEININPGYSFFQNKILVTLSTLIHTYLSWVRSFIVIQAFLALQRAYLCVITIIIIIAYKAHCNQPLQ